MPTLSRLSKHSNRSQNALVEPPAAPVAAAAGGGTGEAASHQGRANSRQPQAQLPPNQDPNRTHRIHPGDENQLPTESSDLSSNHPPPGLSSKAGFDSSEPPFVDPRAAPPPAPVGGSGGVPLPPQHQIYGVSPDTTAAGSLVFDNRRHTNFVEPTVNRSQSQRYSTYAALPHQQTLQQQDPQYPHQAYGPASTSLENLHAPEKRSKRDLLKGFFSGSSRSNHSHHHQQQQQQQPPLPPPQAPSHSQALSQQQSAHNNTGGLARRPSRRGSGGPVINTRLSQQPNQFPPEHDWQVQQGPYSLQNSPLPDVGEHQESQYHRDPGTDQDYRSQEALNSANKTIRPVTNEPESPFEEGAYHPAVPHQHQQQGPPPPPHQAHQHQQQLEQPAPPSQPHVQLHQQGQTHRHDPAPYTQQPPPGHDQQQQQQIQYVAATPPTPYQQVGEPRLATSQLGAQQQQQQQHSPSPSQPHQQHQLPPQQNSETVSQISHDNSPVTDPDQRSTSQQSAQASPANYAAHSQDFPPAPNPPSSQLVGASAQQSSMAPPSGAPPASRDSKAPPRGEVPAGPPPGYRHSNASMGTLNIPPGQPGSQNPAFRGEGTPRFDSPSMDQGRHSPQPEREAAEGEKQFKDLLTKYKNVKRLYFDGKSQIENLSGQVEQLQNAVANQRITQSRTALDDNEYATRFNRLNGAINNLSFNIRKDWRSLPPWLSGFVSPDALKTGKQEMTAIGRAVVARWLVDEFFDKCFHPGLEPLMSSQLKEIELSIRGNAYTMNSQEEFSALTTKVVQWRMATLDGLQKTLNSSDATDNRQDLTSKATTNLTAYLYQFLNNPPPPGVEGSTSMIIELAVGIAANLPQESRDVAITYPLPGDPVRPDLMEVEKTELPPLEVEGDADSDYSDDEKDKNKNRGEKTKSGMWNLLPPRKDSLPANLGRTSTDAESNPVLPKDIKTVRFSGFPAWEVRGRQVLMKAPVWTV